MSTVTDDLVKTVEREDAAGRKCFAICIAHDKRIELWQEMERVMLYRSPEPRMPYRFTSFKVAGAHIGLIL